MFPANEDFSKIVAAERALLRALCSPDLAIAQWKSIDAKLAPYEWSEPDHAVVFKALQRARSARQEMIEKNLAAHATLLGFPEIDWKVYFEKSAARAPADVMKMIDELARS